MPSKFEVAHPSVLMRKSVYQCDSCGMRFAGGPPPGPAAKEP